MRPALLIAILLFSLGCQPAHRFPSTEKKATPTAVTKPRLTQRAPATVSTWLAPTEAIDFDPPIRFVAREPGQEKRWGALPAFWNKFPPPGAGPATLHLGLDPLGAALAVALGGEMDAIEVKVPRHLGPIQVDPNNPPSLDRWRLGRKIFFEPVLVQGTRTLSCAECHQPDRGFSDGIAPPVIDGRRTISLIDVAVRTPLFWDGRVERLEETFLPVDPTNDLLRNAHRWDGVADRLQRDEWYRIEFRRLMGIERISQDAVAKVLAIYLRTILAGDSLVDRAAEPHSATTFAAVLDDAEVRRLNRIAGIDPPLPKETVAQRIAEGERLALGSGRCYQCHAAPGNLGRSLTFHNTLVGDSEGSQIIGKETGRFAVEPIGMKNFAMRGAYRAPPLRDLIVRAPYFHDGDKRSLRAVLQHYNLSLDVEHPLLDPILVGLVRSANVRIEGGRLVTWYQEQVDALVFYLGACEGEAVDPIVSRP